VRMPWLFVASLVLVGTGAQASEELFFQVAQPVISDNGVLIVHVPYASNNGSCCPAVAYTCRANTIDRDTRIQNRNAANLLGIAIVPTPHVPPDMPDWMCDTLDVMLDLTRMNRAVYDPTTTRQVIEKTEDCMRENAWTCDSHLRILRIEVKGPTQYRRLGGTFKVVRFLATPTGY